MESAGAEAVYRSIVGPTGLPADGKLRAASVPDTWPLFADTVAEQPGTRDSTPPWATTDTHTHTRRLVLVTTHWSHSNVAWSRGLYQNHGLHGSCEFWRWPWIAVIYYTCCNYRVAQKTGPSYLIANILKTPWPNCVEIGELLQYLCWTQSLTFCLKISLRCGAT